MDAREQAVQALQQAGASAAVNTVKDSGVTRALTGIGYALLYVGDVIKGDRNKFEPPF